MKGKSVFLARLIPLVFLLAFASEDDFRKRIQEKLKGYYDRNMPVKLTFFFNQSQYVPGDTIFFRALFVKAVDHQPVPGRQIVNVDVTDHEGITVLQQKIVLENGWAGNQIVIPRDLLPGAYTLVGHTNWMKNHDHRLLSYNRLLISGRAKLAMVNQHPLGFYPEGGVLMKGVNNKIVAMGNPGEEVTITDAQNRPVSSVALDRFGMGLFYLTPLQNETYKGISERAHVDLPQTTNNPVSMVVTPSLSKSPLEISLEKSDAAEMHQAFYLTIVDQNKMYYSERISFSEGRKVTVTVPYEKLVPGLSLITLFREDGIELLNRIVFTRDVSSARLRLDVDKLILSPREKAEVSLQLMNDRGEPVAGNVSVTVQDSALLPAGDHETITQKLSLSDLPYSALTHSAIGEMDDYTLNNFLITQEWCRFTWKDVMSDKKFDRHQSFSFARLTGRAIHPDGKRFGDSTQVTFFLQQDAVTYQAYVDSEGNFDFPVGHDFESTEVFYRVETKGRRENGISIQPQVSYGHSFILPAAKESSEQSPLGLFTAKRMLIDNAYRPTLDLENYTRRSKQISDNSLSEYFVADIEVKPADYLLFPTMEETFREIVPSVIHRMVDRRSTIRVHLPDEKLWGVENPLFIIDGVITDDVDYLMSLKPQSVNIIKVINSRKNKSFLGPIGASGVLIVETKIPNNARSVPRASTTFYTVGISQSVPFANVTGKNFQPRVPVIKSCLYWNPYIRTNAKGVANFTFYVGDNTGDFMIIVDGLTIQGDPVSAVRTFQVRFPKTN
jgi:hypothetical protein